MWLLKASGPKDGVTHAVFGSHAVDPVPVSVNLGVFLVKSLLQVVDGCHPTLEKDLGVLSEVCLEADAFAHHGNESLHLDFIDHHVKVLFIFLINFN